MISTAGSLWGMGTDEYKQAKDCALCCQKFMVHRKVEKLDVVFSSLYQVEVGAAR